MRGPLRCVHACILSRELVDLDPIVRGSLLPHTCSSIIRHARQDGTEFRMRPAHLPHGTFVAANLGGQGLGGGGMNVEDADGTIRRAGCETLAVVIELSVVLHRGDNSTAAGGVTGQAKERRREQPATSSVSSVFACALQMAAFPRAHGGRLGCASLRCVWLPYDHLLMSRLEADCFRRLSSTTRRSSGGHCREREESADHRESGVSSERWTLVESA